MTRLALARTLVSGTVTLQGIPYSFTASASGTATADRVPQAKKAATEASNAAAVTAARASIDKILLNNSAVLSDLEITSLISNNLSTTVVVYKPIGIATIASSSNGVNYTLNPNVTIGSNQWLTVPSGKTLSSTADNPLINNGYVQLGDGTQTSSGALKSTSSTSSTSCSSFPATNSGTINVSSGECYTVDSGSTVTNNAYASIQNQGTITNNGSMTNSGMSSYITTTAGSFTNNATGTITNSGKYASFDFYAGLYFTNNGAIYNSGDYSKSCEQNGGNGTCSATGIESECNVAPIPPPPPPS